MKAGVVVRTAIASVLLALLVGASFVILLRQIDALRTAGRDVTQPRSAKAAADAFEKLVIDLDAGVRGFAITGDERFLAPFTAARAAIPAQARRLSDRVQTPDQARRVRGLVRGTDSYVHAYAEPLIAAVRKNRAAGLGVAVTAEGQRRMDGLRAEFARFRAVERARLRGRQQQDDRAASRAATVAAVALGVSVVSILLLGAYLVRAIAVPLRGAAAMAGRLAGGDLAVGLPEDGLGEVGELQRAFNTMGTSLAADRDELQRLADEQAALRRVATLVARAGPTSEVFEAVTREVGLQCDADLARMERFEPDRTIMALAAWSRDSETGLSVGTRLNLEGPSIAAHVYETGRPARVDSFVGSRDCMLNTRLTWRLALG